MNNWAAFNVAYNSSLSEDEVWSAVFDLASAPAEVLVRMQLFEALPLEERTEELADAILRAAGVLPSVPDDAAEEPTSEDSEP